MVLLAFALASTLPEVLVASCDPVIVMELPPDEAADALLVAAALSPVVTEEPESLVFGLEVVCAAEFTDAVGVAEAELLSARPYRSAPTSATPFMSSNDSGHGHATERDERARAVERSCEGLILGQRRSLVRRSAMENSKGDEGCGNRRGALLVVGWELSGCCGGAEGEKFGGCSTRVARPVSSV